MKNKINKKLFNYLYSKPGYLKKSFDYIRSVSGIDVKDEVIKATIKAVKLELKYCINIIPDNYKASVEATKMVDYSTVKTVSRGVVWDKFTHDYNVVGTHVIIPCMHIPYHNEQMYNAFKQYLKNNNIVGLHIIGDFLDMNSLSGHDKGNVSQMTLDFEYSAGNACLDELDSIVGDCVKTYIFGNHENRYDRYMMNVDNAKLGDALQSPTVGLDLINRGYHVFENWKQSYITLGKHLTLCHGEFVNVHTAKKHIDTYRKSVMFAHTHRKQVYVEGNTGGFNIGSMADFNKSAFGYASRAMKESWVNAFGIVNIDTEGYYHVEIPTWINNKFVVGDKIYR
jgi:predicted phosphodiesterase